MQVYRAIINTPDIIKKEATTGSSERKTSTNAINLFSIFPVSRTAWSYFSY